MHAWDHHANSCPTHAGEAIYVKMVVKRPGLDVEKEMSELDLVRQQAGRLHPYSVHDPAG